MGSMKRIYIDAIDAFDKYEAETFAPEKSPLSDEHREMFITGYVQAILDEATKRNQKENANDAS